MKTAQNFEPPLFVLLDTVVRSDPQPSGFAGSVCLGVRHQNQVSWWWVRSDGRTVTTGRASTRRAQATFTLLMDEETARHIFSPNGLPKQPELLIKEGDERLFKRFIARYLNRQSWLGARTGNMMVTSTTKSRTRRSSNARRTLARRRTR